MLKFAAPFPHPGASAFLRGTAEPVRILRRNADGTVLVQRTGPLARYDGASVERTEAAAALFPTAAEAMGLARRRGGSRRRRAG